MSNKPNYRASVSLAEFVDRRREEASITIDLPDGDPIVVPPADLWPVDAFNLTGAKRKSLDDVWRAVLGDAEFDRFAAALPSLGITTPPGIVIDNIVKEATAAKQGATTGE